MQTLLSSYQQPDPDTLRAVVDQEKLTQKPTQPTRQQKAALHERRDGGDHRVFVSTSRLKHDELRLKHLEPRDQIPISKRSRTNLARYGSRCASLSAREEGEA